MAMERIFCPQHSENPCLLKTGTNPETDNYQRNFYICSQLKAKACDFVHHPKKDIPMMLCEEHQKMVGLRIWHKDVLGRILYACCEKPKKGMCGYYQIKTEKENYNSTKKQVQPVKHHHSTLGDTTKLVNNLQPAKSTGPWHVPPPPGWDSRILSSDISNVSEEDSPTDFQDSGSESTSGRVSSDTDPDSKKTSNSDTDGSRPSVEQDSDAECSNAASDSDADWCKSNDSQGSGTSVSSVTDPDSTKFLDAPKSGLSDKDVPVTSIPTKPSSAEKDVPVTSPPAEVHKLSMSTAAPKNSIPTKPSSAEKLIPIISPPLHDPEVHKKPSNPPPQAREEGRPEPAFKVGYQSRKVIEQINQVETLIRTLSHRLPDRGAELQKRKALLYERLKQMKKPPAIDLSQLGKGTVELASKKGITHQARMLTSGAVEHLHSSLENCPTEDTLADDPPGLRADISLMPHQKRALAWMNWREKQSPSAGILADDMGLGKTLSMLSLVAATKKPEYDPQLKEWLSKSTANKDLLKCAGTLVVVPASLMMQWDSEVKLKFKPRSLCAIVYHGNNRTKFPQDLVDYDLVITTYNIVGLEAVSCPSDDEALAEQKAKSGGKKKKTTSFSTLFQIYWRRVILDEAHVIRNHKTGVSIGACKLKADFRWAVTGTPIHNNLKDFYSLIRFIQLAPFDDFRVWKATVEQRGSLGMRRLNTMVSSLMLRRTKEEMEEKQQLKLTKRDVVTHMIKLRPMEREIYQVLFKEAQKVMYRWLEEQGEVHTSMPDDKESEEKASSISPDVARVVSAIMDPYLVGSRGRCVLGLLLRLRQSCCHLTLLTSALKKAESDQNELDLDIAMGALTLEPERDGEKTPITDSIPKSFIKEEMSTKIANVLEELERIKGMRGDPPQKSVIVSQWTSMLDIMQYHLDNTSISYSRIDGSVNPRNRQDRMEEFNGPHKNPTVMLLSLQAGGVGLNLIGGNHIFMLDMHWNPALEVQAADRCHRVGQKRDVFIHKFVCESTVEERILQLQHQKLMLAKNVLDGASEKTRKNRNKLSLNDLKTLFEIN